MHMAIAAQIRHPTCLLAAAAFAIALAVLPPSAVGATRDSWAPVASEKLMQLPGDFLRKAVDNDFNRSGLARQLVNIDERVALKRATLTDLQAAIERAEDPEIRIDLQHQFLNEKRDYIELVAEQQEIRRRRADIKVRLYERLLKNWQRENRASTPEQAAFVAKQTEARKRFEASAALVDQQLLTSTMTAQSRYASEYAKNLSAVQELVRAINAHPMNAAPSIDGQPIGRAEYLRQLIAENEGERALIDQESAILGHMAKLVSLDALALSEGIDSAAYDVIDENDDEDAPNQVTSAIKFFTSR